MPTLAAAWPRAEVAEPRGSCPYLGIVGLSGALLLLISDVGQAADATTPHHHDCLDRKPARPSLLMPASD